MGIGNDRSSRGSAEMLSWRYSYSEVCLREISPPPIYPLQFCQQCHSGEHESLLLLCDGCDKGTHTYCCKVDYHVQYVVYLCDENCVDQ